ncbi:MAG: GYDIA family GHMP kinase [Bacteroidales bacterium]
MTNPVFRSNGKLLLTGEYAIMFGALGLAIPLNRFQETQIAKKRELHSHLYWKAYDINGLWFEAQWQLPEFALQATTDTEKSTFVLNLLQAIRGENPLFLIDGFSYVATHFCNFNIHWGLGSSATLLVNLCRWARVDPFRVYFKLFKGSGYDIAAVQTNTPILYAMHNQIPTLEPIVFNPPFIEQMILIYSGKKQHTQDAITKINTFDNKAIERISQLTRIFVKATDIKECNKIIEEHEAIIGQQIGEQPVKAKYFADFPGQIKSLGAWGGDFWLAVSEMQQNEAVAYFKHKGYQTVYPLKEFLL